MKKPLPVQKRPVKKPALMILLLCICCLMAACGEALPPSSGGKAPFHMVVWRTVDGGKTWASSSLEDAQAIDGPGRANFADAQHGWVLLGTGAGAGSFGVRLYRTTDGGQTWALVSAAPGTIP